MTPEKVLERRKTASDQYPTWPETQLWLHEVRREVAPNRSRFDFKDVTMVIDEVGERYGRWQDHECRALRQALIRLEDVGGSGALSGRVRLADFYRSAVRDGQWQFSESASYLRELGALDESINGAPRLIIANYITGPSNCVASSRYYSVCCLDECESLVGYLESNLAAPHGEPAVIASIVRHWLSHTQNRNRTLPQHRLEQIATHHGGLVPLHGRLFAQWLHYVFPRECPYPHVSGTTNPMEGEEYIVSSGRHYSATTEEMQQHMQAVPPRQRNTAFVDAGVEAAAGSDTCAMWTMEEELLVPDRRAEGESFASAALAIVSEMVPSLVRLPSSLAKAPGFRGIALLAALLSCVLTLFKLFVSHIEQGLDMRPRKHFV